MINTYSTPTERLFKNPEVQLLVVAFGVISTFLPWYVQGFNGQTSSVALFAGLFNPNNLGIEMAGVLFYLGLAMCAFHKTIWAGPGLMFLIASVIIGWLSVASSDPFGPPINAGLGLYFGIIAIIFFLIVLIIRAKEIYELADSQITKRNDE